VQKKDLSLLILILVVGAVVAFINPRFLLAGNLSNTATRSGCSASSRSARPASSSSAASSCRSAR